MKRMIIRKIEELAMLALALTLIASPVSAAPQTPPVKPVTDVVVAAQQLVAAAPSSTVAIPPQSNGTCYVTQGTRFSWGHIYINIPGTLASLWKPGGKDVTDSGLWLRNNVFKNYVPRYENSQLISFWVEVTRYNDLTYSCEAKRATIVSTR